MAPVEDTEIEAFVQHVMTINVRAILRTKQKNDEFIAKFLTSHWNEVKDYIINHPKDMELFVKGLEYYSLHDMSKLNLNLSNISHVKRALRSIKKIHDNFNNDDDNDDGNIDDLKESEQNVAELQEIPENVLQNESNLQEKTVSSALNVQLQESSSIQKTPILSTIIEFEDNLSEIIVPNVESIPQPDMHPDDQFIQIETLADPNQLIEIDNEINLSIPKDYGFGELINEPSEINFDVPPLQNTVNVGGISVKKVVTKKPRKKPQLRFININRKRFALKPGFVNNQQQFEKPFIEFLDLERKATYQPFKRNIFGNVQRKTSAVSTNSELPVVQNASASISAGQLPISQIEVMPNESIVLEINQNQQIEQIATVPQLPLQVGNDSGNISEIQIQPEQQLCISGASIDPASAINISDIIPNISEFPRNVSLIPIEMLNLLSWNNHESIYINAIDQGNNEAKLAVKSNQINECGLKLTAIFEGIQGEYLNVTKLDNLLPDRIYVQPESDDDDL